MEKEIREKWIEENNLTTADTNITYENFKDEARNELKKKKEHEVRSYE